MRIVTIGDIHGSALWRNVKPDEWDKIIFIGDYTDHWTALDAHILKNLNGIIELKEANPDKVELLLGNHDLQYMFDGRIHGCSGFRPQMKPVLYELFTEKKILFKAAHFEPVEDGNDYLWTHAGVSAEWYATRFLHALSDMEIDDGDIGSLLNEAFKQYRVELFDVGYERGGYQIFGGPFWADKSETQRDPLPNINQIIGHTKRDSIESWEIGNNNANLTYVDVLEGDNPVFYELTL